jgi:hypothetical protein
VIFCFLENLPKSLCSKDLQQSAETN